MHFPSRNTRFLPMASLALLLGCGSSHGPTTTSLNPGDVNLVFVVSEDLTWQAPGDVNADTACLTSQGLQRTLAMASFLRQTVMGGNNVNGLFALEPATHPQTANQYPDMNALMALQPFALLNQITLSSDLAGGTPYTGQSFPINVSYAAGAVPGGAAVPSQSFPGCQGLDFNDTHGDNETLINGIISANAPGLYVFSAPWETVGSTLANLNALHNYHLAVPTAYAGPNCIYALSLTAGGIPALTAFNSNVSPVSTYPALATGAFGAAAAPTPTPAHLILTGGTGGAVVPAGINRDETVYLVRHAEAHPQGYWSDSNYVGAGQWRALYLPTALHGRIDPDQVWSEDPAQSIQGAVSASGASHWSNVAPALTVQPFAIANGLPYRLATAIDENATNPAQLTSDFFFSGGQFSNHKLLLGWTYTQNPLIVDALLSSYFPGGGAPSAPVWSPSDYDSFWVISIDGAGNLTADFSQYEGIESSALPAAAPQF